MISDACQQCGTCISECPYDPLSGNGIPVLEALSCTGCGICAAVCQSGALEIQNYRYDQLKSQVEGILTAGPRVIVFIDQAAYAAADLAGVNRKEYSPLVRFVQVPSIHIMNSDLANSALENGASGLMLIEGTTDDKLTQRSKLLYNNLKKETRSNKKPIRYSHIETAQYEKLMNLLNVFADQADKKDK